jgi:hypothetical protein
MPKNAHFAFAPAILLGGCNKLRSAPAQLVEIPEPQPRTREQGFKRIPLQSPEKREGLTTTGHRNDAPLTGLHEIE